MTFERCNQNRNQNYVFEFDAEESLSSRVETSKFIPKVVTDMYVVFAVKSGTKLLSYAAAVRRQLFGK